MSCCVRKASRFQSVKTWKTSTDPDYEAKKNRILELYAIADGKTPPSPGGVEVVICMDEFDPTQPPAPPRETVGPAGMREREPGSSPPSTTTGDL